MDWFSPDTAFSLLGLILSFGLAVYVLGRGPRTFETRAFACGMVAFAVERGVEVWVHRAVLPSEILLGEYYRAVAVCLLPAPWLFFSLAYARENYKEYLGRWKWGVIAVSTLPILFAICFRPWFFAKVMAESDHPGWVLALGWPGYACNITLLLCSVLILINLERTLRASVGTSRWRIKFTVLGIGGIFAVRVYYFSDVLLFSSVTTDGQLVNATVLILAELLIMVSVLRDRLRSANIYVSQHVLHQSVTLVLVGGYLFLVGVVAKTAQYLQFGKTLLDNVFFVFLVLMGIALLLLSDDVRHRIQRFVFLHFQRPSHDYRKIWTTLTERTVSLVGIRDICAAIAKTVSETFGVSSVSIWLTDETRNRPGLSGSTSLSRSDTLPFENASKEVAVLAVTMRNRKEPVDLKRSVGEIEGWRWREDDPLPEEGEKIRYCAPLACGTDFVGIMTLNERISGEEFSYEDFDLLKTICEQAASILLNHRLFDSLARAREMEAFQAFSAFFVHDLKNVASTLSLTLENLPLHYDKSEFREDALRIMGSSLEKIRNMSSRMSMLNQKLELHCIDCDLNEIVAEALSAFNASANGHLITELGELPLVRLDPEQFQKVVTNLVLNAREASAKPEEVRIITSREGECVTLSVSDNGAGMTEEFMQKQLFHPFKTTKARGLGVGLYQSKVIVEAHRGTIEVSSRSGSGSTFRVLLPIGERTLGKSRD